MTRLLSLLLCFTAGTLLGGAYFTGLWVTVRRLPTARHPFLALYGSFLARTALLMAGFGLLLDGRGPLLAAALAGFLLARGILVRHLGRWRLRGRPRERRGPEML